MRIVFSLRLFGYEFDVTFNRIAPEPAPAPGGTRDITSTAEVAYPTYGDDDEYGPPEEYCRFGFHA